MWPPTKNTANLASAVDNLYLVFSTEPPPVIEGCPCCLDTRNTDELLATPLRHLSGDQLWRYVTGAYLTVGSDRDFRYLMPRIFELAALRSCEVPDTEIVIGKLGRAHWERWPTHEKEAVLGFLDAWFAVALERDLPLEDDDWIGDQTESLLCGMAIAGLPIADCASRLTEPAHATLLTDLRQRYPQDLSPFWEDAPGGLAQLSATLGKGSV